MYLSMQTHTRNDPHKKHTKKRVFQCVFQCNELLVCLLWCVSLRRCKALLVCTRVFQCVLECNESFNVTFNADPHKKHLNTLKNESFNVSFQGFFSVLRSFLCGSLLLCLFKGLFCCVSLRLFKCVWVFFGVLRLFKCVHESFGVFF